MNSMRARICMVAVAALLALGAALPAVASEYPREEPAIVRQAQEEPQDGSTREVEPFLIWMAFGVAGTAVALAGLYLVKKRLGGFPANPSWTAPISIMRARDLPGDGDSHDAGGASHAPGH